MNENDSRETEHECDHENGSGAKNDVEAEKADPENRDERRDGDEDDGLSMRELTWHGWWHTGSF